jgi:hypothetical protein
MLKLFGRKALIPVWTGVVLGSFALFGPTLTFGSGLLLLLVAVPPPMILFILSADPPLTLSEAVARELNPVDQRRER